MKICALDFTALSVSLSKFTQEWVLISVNSAQKNKYICKNLVSYLNLRLLTVFQALSSPAYMALTYSDNPIDHSFDFCKKAALGISREPGSNPSAILQTNLINSVSLETFC